MACRTLSGANAIRYHDAGYDLAEPIPAMITISKFAASVKPSATLAAGAKARELRTKGVKVFDFSLGEPDFNTPAHICAAADAAVKAGHTH